MIPTLGYTLANVVPMTILFVAGIIGLVFFIVLFKFGILMVLMNSN